MKGERLAIATVAVVVLGILVTRAGLWLHNYRECRAHGFSRLYCVTMR